MDPNAGVDMTANVSLQQIEEAVRRLTPQKRQQVLLFVEFLEYLSEQEQELDASDDAGLWDAVLAHQAFRKAHPGQPLEVYESREAFMKATDEP